MPLRFHGASLLRRTQVGVRVLGPCRVPAKGFQRLRARFLGAMRSDGIQARPML